MDIFDAASIRSKLDDARRNANKWESEILSIISQCNHSYVVVTGETLKDEGHSDVRCFVCAKHLGKYCAKSPTGICDDEDYLECKVSNICRYGKVALTTEVQKESENTRRIVLDGKYEIIYTESPFELKAMRYGKEWRDLAGDNLVLALVSEVLKLQEAIQTLGDALVGGDSSC